MKDCSLAEIAKVLQTTDKIVLTTHVNSDGDALGSLLGLYMALRKLGKEVEMFIDDDLSPQFVFLPEIKEIKKPVPGAIFKADLLVVLDASDYERIGKVGEFVQATKVMNIDHHISNKGFSDFRFLDIHAAATCEIIFTLIKELGVEIDKAMAIALYTGIVTDCGFFRYANTTSATLRIAAELLDAEVEPNEIADFLEMQTVENLHILPKVLDTLEFYFDGLIASISIVPSLYREDMDGDAFIKYPRYVDGVEVAILFKGVASDVTRISMRSRKLDVSKIALEFGGGGHMRAAGCTIEGNITQAKNILLSTLAKYMGVS